MPCYVVPLVNCQVGVNLLADIVTVGTTSGLHGSCIITRIRFTQDKHEASTRDSRGSDSNLTIMNKFHSTKLALNAVYTF